MGHSEYPQPFPTAVSALACTPRQTFRVGRRAPNSRVEFTVLGRPFVGLNGGPNFKANEAISFMVLTDDQKETDRYWNAIVSNGGGAFASSTACSTSA